MLRRYGTLLLPFQVYFFAEERVIIHASTYNHVLRRLQAAELWNHQKQEKQPRAAGNEQILPLLQKAHCSQRNKITAGGFFRLNTKPNIFARLSRWFREMKSELKKVVWPNRKQLINNTWIVLVMLVVVGAIIAAYDYASQFFVVRVIIEMIGSWI